MFIGIMCVVLYAVSVVEIWGSHWLSSKEHGKYSKFYLGVGTCIPFLSPFIALAIYSTASELYDKKQRNTTEVDESFYGWLSHGFKTINEWSRL